MGSLNILNPYLKLIKKDEVSTEIKIDNLIFL
jgi:hypothetical protein